MTDPGNRDDLANGVERATDRVDVYRRSADAMRDVTKWTVSLVPGAGVIVTIVTIMPELAKLSPSDRKAPIVWLCLAAACGVVALLLASRVLTAGQSSWGSTVRQYAQDAESRQRRFEDPPKRSLRAELEEEAVLRVYGYRSVDEFFEGLVLDEPGHGRSAVAAGTVVMDFAALRSVRARFRWFAVVGTLLALCAVAALGAAHIKIRSADPPVPTIVTPMSASVAPTSEGLRRLVSAASCETPSSTGRIAVWVVAGTLDKAVILIDDAACDVAHLEWIQSRDGPIIPERG